MEGGVAKFENKLISTEIGDFAQISTLVYAI